MCIIQKHGNFYLQNIIELCRRITLWGDCLEYKKYKEARDAAWAVLLRCGVKDLPVQAEDICGELGLYLRSYQAGAEMIAYFGLTEQCAKSDGFTKLYHGQYYIFYRDDMSRQRIRFTVMHEVGHVALGHLREEGYTEINREPVPGDSLLECQANIFASRVLAPACVLHDLGSVTPEQIAALCDISLTSARFRAGRMSALEKRQKFLSSELERRVFQQFFAFRTREKFHSLF